MKTCPFNGPVTVFRIGTLDLITDTDGSFNVVSFNATGPIDIDKDDRGRWLAHAINEKLARDAARPDTPNVPMAEGA